MLMRLVFILAACTVVVCFSSTASAQATVTILFEGGEAGIEDGTTDFSFMFGQVTVQENLPRVIQLALKIHF